MEKEEYVPIPEYMKDEVIALLHKWEEIYLLLDEWDSAVSFEDVMRQREVGKRIEFVRKEYRKE